jgi:two-component system, sensor histidine kinase and response regulator
MVVSAPVLGGQPGWRPFVLAAAAFGLFAAAFVVWLALRLGGDAVTTAVDDIAEAVAALVAAVSCAFAARRSTGTLRRAWALISAAAATWCAGEIVWSIYEVGLGESVPYPGLPDAGFVAAIPLTIAGIVTFGNTARGTSVGLRLWLDRAIVALALLASAWALGLDIVVRSDSGTWLETTLNVVYPLGDIAICTVLILAIRRATDETQGRLFLLLGGVAANAIADSAFSYLNATGAYGAIGSELDAGWVIGYLMIALAAIWPSERVDRTSEERPIDLWQLALPWLAILLAAVVLLTGILRNHPIDAFGTVLIGLLAVLLMISQFAAHNQSYSLLVESRLAAATLNDVIVHAPLGVVRLSEDLTVLQANPTFASILRTSVERITGASLSGFFAPGELDAVRSRLEPLLAGDAGVAEFDSQATRDDGRPLWLHWTASLVRRPDGKIDYLLVMFEDVSARRAAADVAAANVEVLERLNRVKSQFLTKVSHEFRTALVGIQGFSEYIGESEKLEVDEVKNFAKEIYDDARRLNASLTEMLELDSQDVPGAALHLENIDIGEIVSDAVAEFQVGTSNRTIRCHLVKAPPVAADPELMRQVMRSLLGRAVTYSPVGSVIDVAEEAQNGEVRVSVANPGNAVAADLEAQLIGRAGGGQLERVTALATGVGLPVARQIVEMHGGRLSFETGDSTVLTLSLPIAR